MLLVSSTFRVISWKYNILICSLESNSSLTVQQQGLENVFTWNTQIFQMCSALIFVHTWPWCLFTADTNLLSQSQTHYRHSFIQEVCLTTRPKPLPKRALHIVRSRASLFEWEYPLLSLMSSSSFLRLLPRLPVTSIPHNYIIFC